MGMTRSTIKEIIDFETYFRRVNTFVTVILAAIVLCSGFGSGLSKTGIKTTIPAEKTVLQYSYSFSFPKYTMDQQGMILTIDGLDLSTDPGKPIIPVKIAEILIPKGKVVERIEVIPSTRFSLPEPYIIPPSQEPVPLNYVGTINRTEPDPIVYNSPSNYPGKLYDVVSLQHKNEFSILYLRMYPLQWVPITKMVYCYPSFTVKLTLTPSTNRYSQSILPSRTSSETINQIRSIIDNPEVLATYLEQQKQTGKRMGITLVDPADSYTYVIITNETLRDSTGDYTFQDLIQSKIDKGLTATIVTVEDIEACPTYWWNGACGDGDPLFNDTACHIRNFIKDAYQNWGTQYILLGGDGDGGGMGQNSIPPRPLYDPLYPTIDTIASDLYYSCLQGSFDSDKDGMFGEPGDGADIDPLNNEVDLLSEVAVGRAPVDNAEEVSNFVQKTLAYDAVRNDPYLANVLMAGEYLGFGGIASFGGNYKDEIKDGSNNHGYTTVGIPPVYNISTLYDRDWPGLDPQNPLNTGWPKTDIIERINAGIHIINHLGHGNNFHVLKLDEPVMMRGGVITGPSHDVENLTNDQFFFLYTQACYAGSFDNRNDVENGNGEYFPYDCIAECFVTTPHGAFACIANSRYGWGMRSSTDGPSQCFDREFFDALYGENIRSLGWANQDSKEDNIGKLMGGYSGPSYIRYCYYEIVLLGDPEISLKPMENVGVISIDAANQVQSQKPAIISTTLGSNGISNQTNVVVRFSVDNGEIETQIIPFFERCTTQQLSFNWLPLTPGVHSIQINVTVPEGNDEFSFDNEKQQNIIVGVQNRETGECFGTIQQALDDPDTLDGHHIVIPAGLYQENLVITKGVFLIGLQKNTTIIDGCGAPTISINGVNNINITELTIANGTSGITIHDAFDITLYQTIINKNTEVGVSLSLTQDIHIVDNDIIENAIGVRISADTTLVYGNTISGNELGILITGESSGTLIYHNNLDNTQNALDENGNDNYWDNGYYDSSFRISGGNWWSNDKDADVLQGPDQNITGSDGILDKPYFIPGEGSNLDRYPLKEPWSGWLTMIIYIDDDNINGPWQGTPEYPFYTIQDGVNKALIGDTVFVRSGMYPEKIVVNKSVKIIGEEKTTTFINGPKEANLVSIFADGVTISGFTIFNNGTHTADIGIWANNTRVFDNILGANAVGIAGECSFATISENIIENTNMGIYLTGSIDYDIYKNVISNNHQGIVCIQSEKIVVRENKILNNLYGIYIPYSKNNTIVGNEIIDSGYFGICLFHSYNNIISKNLLLNNADAGLLVSLGSTANKIVENTISHNGYGPGNYLSGVSLFSGSNSLYHNNFVDNYQQVVNSGENLWNKSYSFGGNYWDTYLGDDLFQGPNQNFAGSDGIIDIPYIVSGNTYDYYPLVHSFLLGDMNVDGELNNNDINAFVLAMNNPIAYQMTYQLLPSIHGDINQDGFVDFNDINPFTQLLLKIINNPPASPLPPQGPSQGIVGVPYSVSTSTTDADGDQVRIRFDWGESTLSDWTSFVNPGVMVSLSAMWNAPGEYLIKAKAQDIHGAESSWSETLLVRMYLLGDTNGNGDVGFDDINSFIFALSAGETGYYAAYPFGYYYTADCNMDGAVNFNDIGPFVALLGGE